MNRCHKTDVVGSIAVPCGCGSFEAKEEQKLCDACGHHNNFHYSDTSIGVSSSSTSDDRRRRSGGESSEGSEHPKPEGEESARKRIKIQHAKLKPKHDVGSFEVFWQELVTCKKQQLDDTPSCLLTLQNGAYIFGQIGAGSDLFIRECYVQIYDSVIAEMQVIEAKGTSVNKANAFGVLIVGTPGIGKSLFLCYAMWRLAQDYPQSNIVYFNYFEQRYYLLLADGTSDSVVDPDHLQSLLRNPDTFLLFDAAGKEHPPIVNARTIVVSSPDERQYKQWQKARKLCRYMPAWTLDEIMLAHKHIPLYGLVTDVEERFRIVGGVPRFVLDNTVALKKIKFDAAAWINACDLDAVLSAINGGFAGGGGEQVVTAKLINLVANSPAYDELLRVEWMSSYIASGVVAHYFKDHQAKVVSFLRAASESDRLGGIFGDAFEPYAHLRLAEGGVFNVRSLGAPSTGQQIELQPTEVAWFHDASEFAKFDDKLYGRPVSDSFPTIDSAIQPNSVFQITTSLTHDLKLAGLIEIIAALKDTNLHHFYVAVPEMFFHKFTTTPIKPPNGEMPKTVQQYVLALPLPTVHSHPLESLESGVRHRLLRDGFDVTVCDSILNTVRSETERQYLRDHGFKVTDAKGKHSTWTAIGGEIHSKTHIITLFKTRHGEITAIIKQKPDHAAAAAAAAAVTQ